MLHALAQDGADVAVGQGVKDLLALPAVAHQLGLLQGPELVGDGRLAHVQKLGDVTHAHLRRKEDIEDLDAGGVGEELEELRQVI